MDVLTVTTALCGTVVQDKFPSGDNKVYPDPDLYIFVQPDGTNWDRLREVGKDQKTSGDEAQNRS